MHDIRYDEINDEFLVVNPFAEAILTFRGGADGQEGPIRIIQGPQTGTIGNRADVDPIHNEIFTYSGRSIKVYPREANGDVAPIRIIQGPDTELESINVISVDPINDIMVVGLNSDFGSARAYSDSPDGAERGALLIFNRTDEGNVKPRAVIRGPNSGIVRINQMRVYPERKFIVAAMPGIRDHMEPEDAFLGVWSYDDDGDVPPMMKLPVGPTTTLKKPFGVVLNPEDKEVIISDMRLNGILVFSLPEIF
jgi:hypothetical protein